MAQYLAFVALVAVLVIIPGPAVVLIMQKAVTTGLRGALVVSAGVLTADFVWAGAAAAGVTAVLVASEPAFLALRLAGAAYLVWLGLKLLFGRKLPLTERGPATTKAPIRHAAAFRQGFLCDMTNPKTVLIFTSVIPQFVPDGNALGWPVLLGLTFSVLGFLSLLFYSLVMSRAGRAVRRPRLQRGLLRGSGGVLVGFGAGLVLEAR
jgi:threonine/homoserine/homoserine lactone efflux protein